MPIVFTLNEKIGPPLLNSLCFKNTVYLLAEAKLQKIHVTSFEEAAKASKSADS